MDAERSTAIQAIHGAVHVAHIGVKYTWFGGGYLSNVFFKMIANKPMYKWENGGDLTFGGGGNIFYTATGDIEGKPVAQTGWRASCMYGWDTPEGGPCFLRPTPVLAADAPNPDKIGFQGCMVNMTRHSTNCTVDTTNHMCTDAWCDENLIEYGVQPQGPYAVVEGPWYEGVGDASNRHNSGW